MVGKDIRADLLLLSTGLALLTGCGHDTNAAVTEPQERSEIVVERGDLPPADFRKAARSQSFRGAVADFEKRSGGERVPVRALANELAKTRELFCWWD